MRAVRLLALALFVWLLIAQLGMFTQGWQLWTGRDSAPAPADADDARRPSDGPDSPDGPDDPERE